MPGRLLVLLCGALCAAAIGVFAQAPALPTHTVTGTVSDPSGAVLPGVTVELTSPISADSARTMTTGRDGTYRFDNVLPGVYVLTFELQGFALDERDLELGGGGGDTQVDVRMTLQSTDTNPLLPERSVVCGLTIIRPPNPEPMKRGPSLPQLPNRALPGGPKVTPQAAPNLTPPRYTLRMVVPDICQ